VKFGNPIMRSMRIGGGRGGIQGRELELDGFVYIWLYLWMDVRKWMMERNNCKRVFLYIF
jgi:hypothetical protein